MAEISKITLPSGNTYDLKDATARSMISGGISFNIVWTAAQYASSTAPSAATLASIPYGVDVYYNSGTASAVGTLAATEDTKGKFYLIYSKTQKGDLDLYEEYATIEDGSDYFWEKIGDTMMDLSDMVTNVTLNKQTSSAITGYSNTSSDTFLKGVTVEATKKLVTTTIPNVTGNSTVTIPNVTGNTSVTIPNVTSAGTASSWSFTMGSGTGNEETLIISGTNGTAPTLGTALTATNTTLGTALTATNTSLGSAITAATGTISDSGSGDSVVTGVTPTSTGTALTGLGTPDTATVLNNNTSITVTKAG